MMRLIYFSSLLVIVLTFSRCDSNKVVYHFAETKFVFETDSFPYGQKYLQRESSAGFSTYEFKESGEAIEVHVLLNGYMPKINTIEKISMELSQKNEKGELIKIEAKKLKEFKAEYTNGTTVVSTQLKNEHINEQVNWKDANWGEYTVNNNIIFSATFVFEPEEFTKELLMKFKIKWKDKEKEFETTMTKDKYKGPKFNPKF